MADEEYRALERAALAGDEEAIARYRRQRCRIGKHSWNHYKGGDYVCRLCGFVQSQEREFGNQTFYCTAPTRAELAAEDAAEVDAWLAEDDA